MEIKSISQIQREDGRVFRVGDIVTHFKGNEYQIIGFAYDCDDLTPIVVYKNRNGILWVRKVSEFISKHESGVWRFN